MLIYNPINKWLNNPFRPAILTFCKPNENRKCLGQLKYTLYSRIPNLKKPIFTESRAFLNINIPKTVITFYQYNNK